MLETAHPYPEGDTMERTVFFGEHASSVTLHFDTKSVTSRFYDKLVISWEDEAGAEQEATLHGEGFKQPLTIASDYFRLGWSVIGKGQARSKHWGWRLTASAE